LAETDQVSILGNLSKDDRARLDALLCEMSNAAGFKQTLDRLLSGWRDFVLQVERKYDDSIYEYLNDLSVRDSLARLVQTLSHEGRDVLTKVIQPLDERFIAATNETSQPLVKLSDGESLAWWYYRVPANPGKELLDDLQSERLL